MLIRRGMGAPPSPCANHFSAYAQARQATPPSTPHPGNVTAKHAPEVGLRPGGEEHGASGILGDVGQGEGQGGGATHDLACGCSEHTRGNREQGLSDRPACLTEQGRVAETLVCRHQLNPSLRPKDYRALLQYPAAPPQPILPTHIWLIHEASNHACDR